MAVDAVACRDSGNQYGYTQYLLEMEAMGLDSTAIQALIASAGNPSNGSGPRDPRLPIPEEEWERPRSGFVR